MNIINYHYPTMLDELLPHTLEVDDNSHMVFDQETGQWYDMSIADLLEVEAETDKGYFADTDALNRDYESYLYNR